MSCDHDNYGVLHKICSSKFCGRIYRYGLFIDPERKKLQHKPQKCTCNGILSFFVFQL